MNLISRVVRSKRGNILFTDSTKDIASFSLVLQIGPVFFPPILVGFSIIENGIRSGTEIYISLHANHARLPVWLVCFSLPACQIA